MKLFGIFFRGVGGSLQYHMVLLKMIQASHVAMSLVYLQHVKVAETLSNRIQRVLGRMKELGESEGDAAT